MNAPPPVSAPDNQIRQPTVRDPRLDFFRGAALMILLYDHIMERLDSSVPFFLRITPYHWGLFSAASIFVFISGQAYGLVFGRLLDRSGFTPVLTKSYRRAAQLYGANLLTFGLVVAVLTALHAVNLSAGPLHDKLAGYQSTYGFAGMFAAVAGFVIVPDFFSILPLYILFLLLAPAAVWGISRRPLGTLAISVGLYLASRAGLFAAYAPALESRLYFNPIAWQVLFVAGIAVQRLSFPLPRDRVVIAGACAIVAYVALRKAVIPGLVAAGVLDDSAWWSVPPLWSKALRPELPMARVLYFLMIAYVGAVWIARESMFWKKFLVEAVIVMGRHSLLVFCASIVITWGADVAIAALHAGWHGALVAFAAGAVVSWGLARVAERSKTVPAVSPQRPACSSS